MPPGDDPGEIIPLEQVRTTLPPSEIVTPDEAPDRPGQGLTLCLRCFGGGEVTTPARCPVCLGAREDWCEGISIPCKACYGTGRVNIPCPACEGAGWVREEQRAHRGEDQEQPGEEQRQEQPSEAPSPAGSATPPQEGEPAAGRSPSAADGHDAATGAEPAAGGNPTPPPLGSGFNGWAGP